MAARNWGLDEAFSSMYLVAACTESGPLMRDANLEMAPFSSDDETTLSDGLAVSFVRMEGITVSARDNKVFH